MFHLSELGVDLIFLGALIGATITMLVGVMLNIQASESGPVQLDGDAWCSYASVSRALYRVTEGKEDWLRHEAHQMLRFWGQRP